MQLKAGLRSGETVGFQLPDELPVWSAKQSDPQFQSDIRSLGLIRGGQYFALPAPSSFRKVSYSVDVVTNGNGAPAAARAGYVADDIMVRLVVFYKGSPPMAKVEVKRVGRPRYLNHRR